MASIRKAVIPVAGRGTRFLPVTHAVPKELCPLLDRPTLHYVVEEVADAGVEEVVLVTSPRAEKAPILRYLLDPPDDHPRAAPLRELQARVRFSTVVQHEQRGLGHAVLCAKDAVGDEPFVVLCGDDLFLGDKLPAQALAESFEAEGGGGHVILLRVSEEAIGRYGSVAGEEVAPARYVLSRVVEKPAPGTAPSLLAIVGRYVLPPAIFGILERTPPGVGGEIQLTDALAGLIGSPGLFGVVHQGVRYDAGDVSGYVLANAALGLRRPELAPALREGLRVLLERR